jgi:hypothetical protein
MLPRKEKNGQSLGGPGLLALAAHGGKFPGNPFRAPSMMTKRRGHTLIGHGHSSETKTKALK